MTHPSARQQWPQVDPGRIARRLLPWNGPRAREGGLYNDFQVSDPIQLCDGDGDEGNGDGGGGGDGGDDDGGGDAEARCSAAETAGLIAAVCALRDAIGPVRKAATYALRAICSSDASRWWEAKLAGAPAAWRPKK